MQTFSGLSGWHCACARWHTLLWCRWRVGGCDYGAGEAEEATPRGSVSKRLLSVYLRFTWEVYWTQQEVFKLPYITKLDKSVCVCVCVCVFDFLRVFVLVCVCALFSGKDGLLMHFPP